MAKIELLEKKIKRLKEANSKLEEAFEEKTRELYNSFQEVQQVYDTMKNFIVVFNNDGKILQLNAIAKEILGEITNVSEIKAGNDLLEFASNENNLGKDFELRFKNKKSEGSESYVCHIDPLNGSAGQKFVFMATNMSEIKKEELKRAELQNKIMENSYKEGLAESAISILHNIGNVLTGMTGALTQPKSKEKYSESLASLTSMVKNLKSLNEKDEIENFFSQEKKRELFINLIDACSNDFKDYGNEMESILETIEHKTQHIGSIISVQQQYAKLKSGVKSKVTIDSLLNDCLLINQSKIYKPYIKIIKNWDEEASVSIEKNGFIQVLSNALINSLESIETQMQKNNDDKYIGEICISTEIKGDELNLIIQDNGHGFDQEIKEGLFSFGFSTKERSSGFGLHNCYNFIKNQGGSIDLNSDGFGKGAEFIITLAITR